MRPIYLYEQNIKNMLNKHRQRGCVGVDKYPESSQVILAPKPKKLAGKAGLLGAKTTETVCVQNVASYHKL